MKIQFLDKTTELILMTFLWDQSKIISISINKKKSNRLINDGSSEVSKIKKKTTDIGIFYFRSRLIENLTKTEPNYLNNNSGDKSAERRSRNCNLNNNLLPL